METTHTGSGDCPKHTESVGQQLRAARLRLGLALDEISADTRLTIRNLEAIERDDLQQIHSAFYYKSFVRQFAQRLGLQYAAIESAVEAAVQLLPQPLVPGQDGAPVRPDLPSLRPQRTRKIRWFVSLASLILMVFACSTLYGVWESSRSTTASEPAAAPHATAPPKAGHTDSRASARGTVRPSTLDAVKVQLSAFQQHVALNWKPTGE